MMDEYVPEEPGEPSGRYWMGIAESREIYLNNANRVKKSELKTILRFSNKP